MRIEIDLLNFPTIFANCEGRYGLESRPHVEQGCFRIWASFPSSVPSSCHAWHQISTQIFLFHFFFGFCMSWRSVCLYFSIAIFNVCKNCYFSFVGYRNRKHLRGTRYNDYMELSVFRWLIQSLYTYSGNVVFRVLFFRFLEILLNFYFYFQTRWKWNQLNVYLKYFPSAGYRSFNYWVLELFVFCTWLFLFLLSEWIFLSFFLSKFYFWREKSLLLYVWSNSIFGRIYFIFNFLDYPFPVFRTSVFSFRHFSLFHNFDWVDDFHTKLIDDFFSHFFFRVFFPLLRLRQL